MAAAIAKPVKTASPTACKSGAHAATVFGGCAAGHRGVNAAPKGETMVGCRRRLLSLRQRRVRRDDSRVIRCA